MKKIKKSLKETYPSTSFAWFSSFLDCQFTKDFLGKLGYSRKNSNGGGGGGG